MARELQLKRKKKNLARLGHRITEPALCWSEGEMLFQSGEFVIISLEVLSGSWRCHPSKRRRVIIESDDED